MNKLYILIAMFALAGVLNACDQDGPAEKTGEAIDETVDKADEAIDKTFDAPGDGPAENAGEEIDEAVDETGEQIEETEQDIKE